MSDPSPEEERSSSPRSSFLRKILKGGVILVTILFLFLVGIALFLTYLFPAEVVKQELETRGSEILQGTVQIDSLSFNILTGLELRNVDFQKNNQSLLTLKRLNFDYNLLALFQQRVKINEISIEGAQVSLNLEDFQGSTVEPEPDEEEIPPLSISDKSPELPPIPISLELDAFIISRSHVTVIVNPTMSAIVRDFNLEISGGITETQAELEGAMQIVDIALDMDGKKVRFPLSSTFVIRADLQNHHLHIEDLSLGSDSRMSMSVSGQVQEFLGHPTVDLSLQDVTINLGSVLETVKEFIPPELNELSVAGVLSPSGTVKGKLLESGFEGEVNVRVDVRDLQVDFPAMSVGMGKTQIGLDMTDIVVKDNQPESASLHLLVDSEDMAYQEYSLQNTHLETSGDFFMIGPVSGKVTFSTLAGIPPFEPMKAMTLPLTVTLEAVGNHHLQEVTVKDFGVQVGDYATVTVMGDVATDQSTKTMNLSISTRVEPHVERILSLVPQDFLAGITLTKMPSTDLITVELQGVLDSEFQPQILNFTGGLHVSELDGVVEALPASGRVEDLSVSLNGDYTGETGVVQGSLSTALHLVDLQYADMTTVGDTALTLHSKVLGKITPTYTFTELQSQDTVNIHVREMNLHQPSFSVAVPDLVLSLKTSEDLLKKNFEVQELRLSSDPILALSVSGGYQMEGEEFHANIEVPYINIQELLNQMSGEALTAMKGQDLGGKVSVSLHTHGQIPNPEEINQFNVPIDLSVQVAIEAGRGEFAGYQTSGVEGNVELNYDPGLRPKIIVKTDVGIQKVQLPSDLPISQVAEVFAKVQLTVDDFNEIRLDPIHVGMKGANVSLTGSLSGFKGFLEEDPDVADLIKNFFSQIRIRGRADLDEFQHVLKPAGMVGLGDLEVKVDILKKEKGPLSLQLGLATNNVTVSQPGLRVVNIDGELSFRKRWEWQESRSRVSYEQSFNPTDVVSQLRTNLRKGKRVHIDLIDLGFLSISNFSTHLLFDRNALKVQNLAMNMLGGGIGGNVMVHTGNEFGVSARLEVARLDLNQLLKENERIKGDSVVDATMGVSLFFEPEQGQLDLSRTELNLFITHIGKEALDRVLVFLDPEGSSPTLVGARSQIKLANPSNVTIQLARGVMGLEIIFSEGLLPTFKLDRIPVGKLKSFQKVTEGIPDWEMIRQVMKMAGSQVYGTTTDGKLVLQ
ncbi:MAG: AsmA family protein [Nitrospirae bacterium]|nr:AsmA family protein [Nitrospirota bacterium]